jgi:hypothetical protein
VVEARSAHPMVPNGAGECGGGCRRGKAAHAGVGAVAGFFLCLLMVWAVGGSERSGCGRVAEHHGVVRVGQFNLSRSQLQALVFLLSSTHVLASLFTLSMSSSWLDFGCSNQMEQCCMLLYGHLII